MNWNRKDLLFYGYTETGIILEDANFNQMNWVIPQRLNVQPSELKAFRIDAGEWEVFLKPNANVSKSYTSMAVLP